MAGNPEEESIYIKIAIYIAGTAIGVGAKLADMYRTKNITFKDVFINSTIAFAAAWGAFAGLQYTGHTELATMVSVLCGRFADDVLQVLWRQVKTFLKIANDDLNNPK